MSLELLVISNKHRLYLIHSVSQHLRRNHFQYQQLVLYSSHEGQSLSFPFQAQLLIVYCMPFYIAQCLGFNLAPSSIFFLLSQHSHLYLIFLLRYYVVVILALRVPSNSVSLLYGFSPYLHTSFPICLLKFSCNSSHDWALSLLNKLRSLALCRKCSCTI